MGQIFKNPTLPKQQRYIPKKIKHEESLQKLVCRYLRLQYPQVIFRSDYASGLHLTQNQAAIHKSLQSGRAFPDIFVFEPMQHDDKHYAGLGLELKKEGTAIVVSRGPRKGHIVSNPHIQEQVLMCKELRKRGYYATIACGLDEALEVIDWYFKRPKHETGSMF